MENRHCGHLTYGMRPGSLHLDAATPWRHDNQVIINVGGYGYTAVGWTYATFTGIALLLFFPAASRIAKSTYICQRDSSGSSISLE